MAYIFEPQCRHHFGLAPDSAYSGHWPLCR